MTSLSINASTLSVAPCSRNRAFPPSSPPTPLFCSSTIPKLSPPPRSKTPSPKCWNVSQQYRLQVPADRRNSHMLRGRAWSRPRLCRRAQRFDPDPSHRAPHEHRLSSFHDWLCPRLYLSGHPTRSNRRPASGNPTPARPRGLRWHSPDVKPASIRAPLPAAGA